MAKIDFEFQTEFGTFRDALLLPDDHGLTDQQVEDMKQQRLADWLAVLAAPPVDEVAPPVDEVSNG